jgi:hypothetical protein
LALDIATSKGIEPAEALQLAANTLAQIERDAAFRTAVATHRAARKYPTAANEAHWCRPSFDGIRLPVAPPVAEWRVQWKPKTGWVGERQEKAAAVAEQVVA